MTGKAQLDASVLGDVDRASRLEWLETNGRGGFASSSVIGANTRRYHGLLVPALDPPVRRHVLLSRVEETIEVAEERGELAANFYKGAVHPSGWKHLAGFRLDPFPVTIWDLLDRRIERAVFLVHGEDTVVLRYSLLRGGPCSLLLRPFVAFRDYHALGRKTADLDTAVRIAEGRASIRPFKDLPELHFHHPAREIVVKQDWWESHVYPREQERGLDFSEDLWSPFELRCELSARGSVMVAASLSKVLKLDMPRLEATERARRAATIAVSARGAPGLEEPLALSADAFVVKRGAGSGTTIIAGYPWFTDWGRDTMISLPGLRLSTGRNDDARDILLSFAKHVDRGMIPNRFPDSGAAPEYNNMDGTLWFVHAIGRYFSKTRDAHNVESHLLPAMLDILERHREGTRYGIRADADGLLTGGEEGVQLTWMDAKVDGWVVTPRQGKPVEINALWINALETTAELCIALGGRGTKGRELTTLAAKARESFGERFWNEEAGCLFDVIDGPDGKPDASLRPNQLLAISLPHPALIDHDRALSVVETVQRELLTPFGLRTLSPRDPRYKRVYDGDRWARDGAYHQGTVWPWLMGPFVRAYLAVHGKAPARVEEAREFVRPLLLHLGEAGLGHVSEIFDGDPPHAPKGCPAQAWSLAELIALLADELR